MRGNENLWGIQKIDLWGDKGDCLVEMKLGDLTCLVYTIY